MPFYGAYIIEFIIEFSRSRQKKILIFMENQDFLAKIFGKLKYSAEEEI